MSRDHFTLITSVMFMALSGCGLKSEKATAIFQDVNSTNRYSSDGDIVIQYPNKAVVPRHLLVGGKLHLLTQVTQDGYLAVVVDHPTWTVGDVENFREHHPELRNQLSKANWPNANVKE